MQLSGRLQVSPKGYIMSVNYSQNKHNYDVDKNNNFLSNFSTSFVRAQGRF
jgi:hypothetical protein